MKISKLSEARLILLLTLLFSIYSHAASSGFCLAQLLKNSSVARVDSQALQAYEQFRVLSQELNHTPKSKIKDEKLEERVGLYKKYLTELGMDFEHVIDPELGNLFYIKSRSGSRAGDLAQHLEIEHSLRFTISTDMIFEGGIEDVKNDFYLSPEHFHTLMTADPANPDHRYNLHALTSIVDHEIQHALYHKGDLQHGVGTPFRAVMEAKGQLHELIEHMDPTMTGAYAARMSFEELHTYHLTLLEDLRFMRENPDLRMDLLPAFRNKLALYLSVTQTSMMLATSIQNHLFIGGKSRAVDYLKHFDFSFKGEQKQISTNEYAISALVTIKGQDGMESTLEVRLGTSSKPVTHLEIKKRLSKWTIDIQSLVKSKITSDLKSMGRYANDLEAGKDKKPPVVSSLRDSGGTSSWSQNVAIKLRQYVSEILSKRYLKPDNSEPAE